MHKTPEFYIEELCERYPALAEVREEIAAVCACLDSVFKGGGKLLLAGNGGSAADSDHIAGELLKGFESKRPLSASEKEALQTAHGDVFPELSERLQGSLPAISLSQQSAIMTAVSNDIGSDLVFAQQIWGLARAEDAVLLISTSGNSENILKAAVAARARGAKVLALTGASGGKLRALSDHIIAVPESNTARVQELHLPVYHSICGYLEQSCFENAEEV